MISGRQTLDALEDRSPDGFLTFHIKEETTNSIEIVGLVTLLPSGRAPLQLKLSSDSSGMLYELNIGRTDDKWLRMNDSKQWNAVYLLGTDSYVDEWLWQETISGVFRN